MAEMNNSSGEKKVDAIARVIWAMAGQRRKMRDGRGTIQARKFDHTVTHMQGGPRSITAASGVPSSCLT